MSLTKTARNFRVIVKLVAAVMFLYYVAILAVIPATRDFFLNLLVDRNPPIPRYGLLDPLVFNPADTKGKPPTIVLDTTNGRLPAGMPRKMTVYTFKGSQYSYLAGKDAQDDATTLGFSEAELVSNLKGRTYQWRSLVSGGVLIIDTETRSILLGTDLYGKSSEYVPGSIDVPSAKTYAVDLLTNLNRYNSTLYKPENFKVSLGQFSLSTITQTKVASDAQVARVDIFGQIDKTPILGPDATKGIAWLILRNPTRQKSPYNYPFIEGYFWDLTSDKDASYPIISVQEAWSQVLAGKGIISSVTPKNYNPFVQKQPVAMERVLINKIYLAYYETPAFQRFLQPIYVFEGNYINTGTEGGYIVYYYPAVTAQYTSKVPFTPPATEDTSQQSSSTSGDNITPTSPNTGN